MTIINFVYFSVIKQEGRISINRRPQFCDFEEMSDIVRAATHQIVDTRDPNYFRGDTKEPSECKNEKYKFPSKKLYTGAVNIIMHSFTATSLLSQGESLKIIAKK